MSILDELGDLTYSSFNPSVGHGGDWEIKSSLSYGSGLIKIRFALFLFFKEFNFGNYILSGRFWLAYHL